MEYGSSPVEHAALHMRMLRARPNSAPARSSGTSVWARKSKWCISRKKEVLLVVTQLMISLSSFPPSLTVSTYAA